MVKNMHNWKLKYDPVKNDHYKDKSNNIHPYAFIRELSKNNKNDVIVTDCGGNVVITNQSFETKLVKDFFQIMVIHLWVTLLPLPWSAQS